MRAASESEEFYLESSASAARNNRASLDRTASALRTAEAAVPTPDDAANSLRTAEADFRLLYERSAPKLFAYLLRVSGERAVAEDLLQETYCRFLLSKAPEMNDAQQQSYLFRISTNLLRDRWRRHRESPLPENLPEPTSGPPHMDRQLELRQAFQQLKVRERQLLWLAYVEGSNHKEIARATGLGHKSVRLLLFRARRKLASLIRAGSSDGESFK
jgi:RNA polymerase sigma-70 factor, ECF subfamily